MAGTAEFFYANAALLATNQRRALSGKGRTLTVLAQDHFYRDSNRLHLTL